MKKGTLCRVVPQNDFDPLANRLAGQTVIFDRSVSYPITSIVVVIHPETKEFISLRAGDVQEIKEP